MENATPIDVSYTGMLSRLNERHDKDYAEQQAAALARTSWTVADLLAAKFPPPKWIVPGLLPVGLAVLAGRPKQGKSFMALQASVAAASGGFFLNRKVDGGPVLYLALEDSPRRLKTRLEMMQAPSGIPLQFEVDWLPLDADAGGLEDLHRRAATMQPRLIVVDTLARAHSKRRDWRDLADATSTMAVLQHLALDRDLCVLCIDHHRKPSMSVSDVVDDVLESTGKVAVADSVLGLYRKRGEHGATLKATGRDFEDAELAVEFDPATGCWQLLGDAREVARQTVQGQLLDALAELDGRATVTELAAHTGLDKGHVSHEMAELAHKGHVKRGNRQGREWPYVLTDDDS